MFELPRIPLGEWVDFIVRDVLQAYLGWFFRLVRETSGWVIEGTESLLLLLPALVFVALAALVAWRLRSGAFAWFTGLAFLLVHSMGLWEDTMQTLALVLVATLIAVAIGVPIGVAAARNDAFSKVARPVLDFMQTLPAFVYLIPAIMFFRVGVTPGLVATLVFAIPPGVRFTELGIRQVDREVIEAATAFGSRPSQTLTRVQIPLALPTIMGGINQVIMLALSMVVIAGMVGAPGLGALVFRAITRLNIGLGAEAGLAVVIVAIFLDRVTSSLGRRAEAQAAGSH